MGGVYWFEIYVSDLARAKKFYADVFGCYFTDVKNEFARLSVFDWGEEASASCAGALVHYTRRRPSSRGTIIYFNVRSLQDTMRQVTRCGGRILRQPVHVSNDEIIVLVADADGNSIGLYSNIGH